MKLIIHSLPKILSPTTFIFLPCRKFGILQEAEAGGWRVLRERKPGAKLVEDAEEAIAQLMGSKERLVLLEAHERIGPLIQQEPLNCEIMMMPGKEPLPVSLMLQTASPFKKAIDRE
jgi:hypothetical protein